VGQAALTGDKTTHAFLYEGGVMKDLNNLVPNKPADLELLSASRLNDSGSMIAYTNTGVVLLSQTSPATAPPVVGQITADDPIAVGVSLSVSASFTDAATDTHTATFTFGDGSSPQPATVTEANGSGTASGSHTFSTAGIYPIALAVTDNTGRTAMVSRNVVVYDPAYGFVTGSGAIQSPAGAFIADPTAMGPATFSFVSKYQKGAKTPMGMTDFRFATANLDFHSDAYEWLVVAGARAQFKGTGSLNDVAGYKFMLTAIDGQTSGGGGVDRFRIKISHYDEALKQEVVVYDNQLNSGS
jgi:probable HAF family extracellular repeat protein